MLRDVTVGDECMAYADQPGHAVSEAAVAAGVEVGEGIRDLGAQPLGRDGCGCGAQAKHRVMDSTDESVTWSGLLSLGSAAEQHTGVGRLWQPWLSNAPVAAVAAPDRHHPPGGSPDTLGVYLRGIGRPPWWESTSTGTTLPSSLN